MCVAYSALGYILAKIVLRRALRRQSISGAKPLRVMAMVCATVDSKVLVCVTVTFNGTTAPLEFVTSAVANTQPTLAALSVNLDTN